MNMIQLECFASLARTLNFIQTSREMHITQPAVSKQIMALEEELGVKLFYRTTHKVILTEEGRDFAKNAETVLKILYEAKQRCRIAEKAKAGRFSIGYTDPRAAELLRMILETFLAETSFVPSLEMGDTSTSLEHLSSHLVDVVLAIKDAHFASRDVVFSKLYDEQFYCVMRKDHPLYEENKTIVTKEDFYPYRQIVYVPRYLLDHSFARGRTLFPVNDELQNIFVNSAEEALLLVKAGAGFTLLPYYQIMGTDDVCVLPWTESPKTPFGIYYRKEDERSAGIEKFLSAAYAVTKEKGTMSL